MSLPIFVLIFGIIVIAAEAAIVISQGRSWGPHSVRVVGLSLIIISAVFLAVSDSQRAGAAYALLGVIAGYLAGRYETKQADQE